MTGPAADDRARRPQVDHQLGDWPEATGMRLRLDTTARRIDVQGRKLLVTGPGGHEELLAYDKLIIGTGRPALTLPAPRSRTLPIGGRPR